MPIHTLASLKRVLRRIQSSMNGQTYMVKTMKPVVTMATVPEKSFSQRKAT